MTKHPLIAVIAVLVTVGPASAKDKKASKYDVANFPLTIQILGSTEKSVEAGKQTTHNSGYTYNDPNSAGYNPYVHTRQIGESSSTRTVYANWNVSTVQMDKTQYTVECRWGKHCLLLGPGSYHARFDKHGNFELLVHNSAKNKPDIAQMEITAVKSVGP